MTVIDLVRPALHAAQQQVVSKQRGWVWNGKEDAPSLTGSLLCKAGGEAGADDCWHGYLNGGVFQEVP